MYREEEVSEILQRASGLEKKKQLERPALSLGEIEAIARESGLDPSAVRQAARDLEQHRAQGGFAARFTGAPSRRSFEREVEGEISTGHHERLAAEIRAAFGSSVMMGQVATLGRSLTWSGFTKAGIIEVNVFPRDGKTVIRVDVNSSNLAGGIFGGLIGGIGGGLGSNVAWILPVALHLPWYTGAAGFFAVLAGAYGLARAVYAGAVGGLHRRVETLVDTLEQAVRRELAPGPPG